MGAYVISFMLEVESVGGTIERGREREREGEREGVGWERERVLNEK